MITHAYGTLPDQVGDLYLPGAGAVSRVRANRDARTARKVPVICLIHGGFWRLPWGRDNIAGVAVDLASRGFAVWSLEYRRVGHPGGGWPGTLHDVAAGIDHLTALNTAVAETGRALDLERVTVVGHSAGGQLALWAAGRRGGPLRIAAAVGLAPVADLRLAQALHCGNGAVRDFLGGTPDEVADRYASASPMQRLPLGIPQLLVHGTDDEDVPVEISRSYARTAAAAGDAVELIELAGVRHMDLIDPTGSACAHLCEWLETLLAPV